MKVSGKSTFSRTAAEVVFPFTDSEYISWWIERNHFCIGLLGIALVFGKPMQI